MVASRPRRRPKEKWSRWADRIAYVCHDFEDAVSAGIVSIPMNFPAIVRERCGVRRQPTAGDLHQRDDPHDSGDRDHRHGRASRRGARRLSGVQLRAIYLRSASRQQGSAVVAMLRALVEYYSAHPDAIPDVAESDEVPDSRARAARCVAYVAGMTDRYAVPPARHARSTGRSTNYPTASTASADSYA